MRGTRRARRHPVGSVRRSAVAGPCLIAAMALGGCKGCGKKDTEQIAVATPPPLGAASQNELTTGLGPARGLEEELVPTATKWRRVFVLDDKRAILSGETSTETLALITEDAGKTWRALRREREGWANWTVGSNGSLLLAVGARGGAKQATEGAVDAIRLSFAALDATSLGPPTPLFPSPKGPSKGTVVAEAAVPAILSADYAAMVAEEDKRRASIHFGGRPGVDAHPPLASPPGEKLVPVPYGRPPMLLSVRGKDLYVRPFPTPGKPLARPQKLAGIVSTPTLVEELSKPPACDVGDWAFQRVKQKDGMAMVGFGGGKSVAFALPEKTSATSRVGCNGSGVIVDSTDAKGKLQVQTCDLTGKCTEPKNNPFRVWPEKHDRVVAMAPTGKGLLAAMTARAGDRWGFYMGQSNDGNIYEQPRVVGEGQGERGRLELGALVPLGNRVLLLLSADITGTSRRGWFVSVTDDGGLSWNTP
jgi:hypothetical protein